MGQTRKKRRTKHRGNAAGVVEARGRTGRKPTDGERKPGDKEAARAKRMDRLNRPPSWRGSLNRSLIATAVFFAFLVLLFKQPVAQAVALSAFVLVFYVPMGYYTDRFLYQRRMAKRKQGGGS
jgi:drug/metabolite transporter (DMT)-like permease